MDHEYNFDVDPVTEADAAALLGLVEEPVPQAPAEPVVALAPVAAPSLAVPVEDPRAVTPEVPAGAIEPVEPLVEMPPGRPAIERLLAWLVWNDGSDMHLSHMQPPWYRVHGSLMPVAGEPDLSGTDIEELLRPIISDENWQRFTETGDLDCSYAMDEDDGAVMTVRFRVNVFRTLGQTGAVMRVIPNKITTLDELGLPPQVKKLAGLPRGLILVTGPTGSGKSTTQAALVDVINTTRTERIFTLEDPVEFTHQSKKSLISHREIGTDTATFDEGLRRVRREDPDVILIGEMRDYETIGAAIEAADTGHLVLATLHTNSAPETISRIINSFPAGRQDQIRVTLASTLKAVICQTLVPSPTAPRGRVVATEIMMVTPGIANNIRENDIAAIANALTDTSGGSISLDAHLAELVRGSKITKKEALKKASAPEALERQLSAVA